MICKILPSTSETTNYIRIAEVEVFSAEEKKEHLFYVGYRTGII